MILKLEQSSGSPAGLVKMWTTDPPPPHTPISFLIWGWGQRICRANKFPRWAAAGGPKHILRTTALVLFSGIRTLRLTPSGKVESLPVFFRAISCRPVTTWTERQRDPKKMIRNEKKRATFLTTRMLSPLSGTYRWLSSAQVLKIFSFKKEKENGISSDFMIIQTNGADFILPFIEVLTSDATRQRKGKWGGPVDRQSKACHSCAGKIGFRRTCAVRH